MTSPRDDRPWLVPLLLAAGAIVITGALLGFMLPWSELLLLLWTGQVLSVVALLALPLILITAIPVAHVFLSFGPTLIMSDELAPHLQRKRQGLLLKQVPRIRDSTARTSRYDAAPGQELRVEAGQEAAADVLDRLVRLKQRGRGPHQAVASAEEGRC